MIEPQIKNLVAHRANRLFLGYNPRVSVSGTVIVKEQDGWSYPAVSKRKHGFFVGVKCTSIKKPCVV
jgi:hypothetical protein